MTLASGTKLGPYEIAGAIGAGGMGEVYRARDTRLGRDVAIKVLPASFASDAERLRRFEQEARAAGALNHPNILAIYDIGTHDGAPFLVTELLEGETLGERLRSGPLPVRKALDAAIQAAHGVAAAHEKGIIHRDLKPANIFLTNDGRLKILDFGLAKLTQRDASGIGETLAPTRTAGPVTQTDAGAVLGTVGYMSPEQVRGKPVDARSDLFALGTILYEMLSGQRAFAKDSSADTMAAILKEEPPELSGEGTRIPPAVERVVRHCLEKNATERFQSARDLAFALESLAGSSTTSARAQPPTVAVNQRRRRRLLFAAIGTAGLVIVGIAGYFLGHGTAPTIPPVYQQLTFSRGLIYGARFAPDGQLIYYSAAWNGQPVRLYSANPNSPESHPLDLTSSSLLALSRSQIAVSLGCKYAFVGVCQGTLATVPISGGAPREITDHVISADWTPDGSEMAAVREANGKFQVEFPLGRVIYESQNWINSVRISPQGNAVAFVQYSTDAADVGAVVVLDRNGKQITRSEQFPSIEGLFWRPSGEQIWFAATHKGWADTIYALNLTGKQRVVLAFPGTLRLWDISKDGQILFSDEQWRMGIQYRGAKSVGERDFSWLDGSDISDISSDGHNVAFSEWGEAAGALPIAYVRKADDASVVKLGLGRTPVFSPDGKWVVASAFNPAHLVLLPVGIGAARSLQPYGLQQFVSAGWMPGGNAVYFAGNDGTSWRVYVQNIEGGAPRAVTPSIKVDQTTIRANFVSPDGKVIFARDLAGKGWLYPVAGGQPRPVVGLAPEDLWVNWTSDGRSVYVFQDKETHVEVFRLELSTGRRQLFGTFAPTDTAGLTGIPDLIITPDGKSYAYSYNRSLSTLYVAHGLQ